MYFINDCRVWIHPELVFIYELEWNSRFERITDIGKLIPLIISSRVENEMNESAKSQTLVLILDL